MATATKEFKFNGETPTGQSVKGTVMASSKRKARKKVEQLSSKHGFRASDLKKRKTFRYRVRHPNGKEVKGEQKAFSAEEVERALSDMGVDVINVQQKWFDFEWSPPQSELVLFVRLAANLLRENLPFDEVLELLVDDLSSRSLKRVIRDLISDLKSGMDAEEAFHKQRGKLGTFTAYMLGIASKSGNMAEIFESTAQFLERKDEFSRNVRNAMIIPAVTLTALIGALIWYVWYIIPATVGLFSEMDVNLPPLTNQALAFSHFLDHNWPWLLVVTIVPILAFVAWARTAHGKFYLHKFLIRLPVLGSLLHKLNIEIFCRVFSILYSGSGDNLRVLRVAAQACGNRYMEYQIRNVSIPMMTAQGAGLVQALRASGVFTSMALTRFRAGSETGSVQESARQLADYYEQETELSLNAAVKTIQTVVSIIITLGIVYLTLLSTEMAFIQPTDMGVTGMGK